MPFATFRWSPCALTPFAISAGAVFAADPAATMPVPGVGIPAGSFVQGLLGLILIIGLLLGTLAVLRRFGGRFGGAQTDGMKIISGLSVGPRERILLVEIGDTWLVVGVTATQIRTLHTLPKGSLPAGPSVSAAPAFAEWLKKVKDRTPHER